MTAFTAFTVSSRLPPEARRRARPAEGRPLCLLEMAKLSAPSATLATSLTRICEPSALTLTRISSNSAGVVMRVLPSTVALSCTPLRVGRPPSWPEDTCTFCSRMAVATSPGVSW
ncbi:hypothetical protein D3C81_1430100 [compost metagenome]